MKLNRKFIFLSLAFGGTFASFGSTATAKDTGLFIGIDKNNVIRKAYVVSENVINYIQTNCI